MSWGVILQKRYDIVKCEMLKYEKCVNMLPLIWWIYITFLESLNLCWKWTTCFSKLNETNVNANSTFLSFVLSRLTNVKVILRPEQT